MDPAAYVLGKLRGAERVAFERHLSTCADCREHVDELEDAMAALPLMAQHDGPSPEGESEPELARSMTLREEIRGQARAQAVRRREAGARVSVAASRPSRPLWRRPAAGFAALALAIALTVALGFASPGAATYQAAVGWHPGGAILSVKGGRGELFVTGMPAPAPGTLYEVWLQHGTAPPRPAGARFTTDRVGRAEVRLPGGLGGVTRVLVSAEPAGASRAITQTPVLIATL